MNILVFSDPLAGLNPDFDTGIALAREGLKRGHSVDWAETSEFRHLGHSLEVKGKKLAPFDEGKLPSAQAHGAWKNCRDYDVILIRRDPPFDAAYISMCWLLSLLDNDVVIQNPPGTLLKFHEKLLPHQMVASGYLNEDQVLPIYLSPKSENLEARVPGRWISKPWLGHGGRGLQSFDSFEGARSGSGGDAEHWMILQPLVERISEMGDRRVFFFNGQNVGNFVRVPKAGSIESNIVRGGSAVLRDLSEKEQKIIPGVERFLRDHRILLAGADVLDEKLSELNITAPTGLSLLKKFSGRDIREEYLSWLEREVEMRGKK